MFPKSVIFSINLIIFLHFYSLNILIVYFILCLITPVTKCYEVWLCCLLFLVVVIHSDFFLLFLWLFNIRLNLLVFYFWKSLRPASIDDVFFQRGFVLNSARNVQVLVWKHLKILLSLRCFCIICVTWIFVANWCLGLDMMKHSQVKFFANFYPLPHCPNSR